MLISTMIQRRVHSRALGGRRPKDAMFGDDRASAKEISLFFCAASGTGLAAVSETTKLETYVRMCTVQSPHLRLLQTSSLLGLKPNQILAQSVNRFLRYGDGVCTCARAHPIDRHGYRLPRRCGHGYRLPRRCAPLRDRLMRFIQAISWVVGCIKRTAAGSLTTHLISAQCAQWFPRYGKGVRTCGCNPPMTCVKHLGNDSKPTHQIWTQSAKPFLRYRNAVCTSTTCRDTPPVTTA